MENYLQQVYAIINAHPSRLGEAYEPQLSIQEELILVKLQEEIAMRVDGILDKALAGNQQEIQLDDQTRAFVLELTAIQKAIYDLVRARGRLKVASKSLN